MTLNTVTPVIVEEEKMDVEHVEEAKVDNEFDPNLVIKSPFEDLSFFVTLKTFKKATFLALLAAFSAAAEWVIQARPSER